MSGPPARLEIDVILDAGKSTFSRPKLTFLLEYATKHSSIWELVSEERYDDIATRSITQLAPHANFERDAGVFFPGRTPRETYPPTSTEVDDLKVSDPSVNACYVAFLQELRELGIWDAYIVVTHRARTRDLFPSSFNPGAELRAYETELFEHGSYDLCVNPLSCDGDSIEYAWVCAQLLRAVNVSHGRSFGLFVAALSQAQHYPTSNRIGTRRGAELSLSLPVSRVVDRIDALSDATGGGAAAAAAAAAGAAGAAGAGKGVGCTETGNPNGIGGTFSDRSRNAACCLTARTAIDRAWNRATDFESYCSVFKDPGFSNAPPKNQSRQRHLFAQFVNVATRLLGCEPIFILVGDDPVPDTEKISDTDDGQSKRAAFDAMDVSSWIFNDRPELQTLLEQSNRPADFFP